SGRAPNGDRVLSAAGVKEILRPQQKAQSELGGETMYGLGWEVSDMNGVTLITKGGSVGAMGSLFFLVPSQKLGVALVFNDLDYGKVGLLRNITKLLLGGTPSPYEPIPTKPAVPPSNFKMPAARWATFAGLYDTRAGLMRLTVRGDTLAGRFEGNDVVLEPSSDSSFVMRSLLREQEGQTLIIKRCGKSMCIWMEGDSSAVRR
ncbi:MAG: serine hydrolase, partial [Gemmatimonadaceae bacterium]|nr:serine hydrolase [Gemmatimonadaceae bacterium]